MSEPKRAKRKKSSSRAAERTTRRARRFEPQASSLGQVALGLICLGAALLGAGFYGQMLRETPLSYAPPLLIAGALALGFGWYQASSRPAPLLVGDPGVAPEDTDPLRWLPWSKVEAITLEGENLTVRGEGRALTVSTVAHPQAAAWIVKEALDRVPSKVRVDEAARGRLKADEAFGEVRDLGPAQAAGARCRASDRVIAFDEDARLCPRCGEVYHKEEVPDECLSCAADLEGLKADAAKA
ncbi:MAG TPA: hypothetical protein VFS00_19020 [Polyangiaceae bacterium]|nr:hypothetical protein [Polyangiaceae bacterium]